MIVFSRVRLLWLPWVFRWLRLFRTRLGTFLNLRKKKVHLVPVPTAPAQPLPVPVTASGPSGLVGPVAPMAPFRALMVPSGPLGATGYSYPIGPQGQLGVTGMMGATGPQGPLDGPIYSLEFHILLKNKATKINLTAFLPIGCPDGTQCRVTVSKTSTPVHPEWGQTVCRYDGKQFLFIGPGASPEHDRTWRKDIRVDGKELTTPQSLCRAVCSTLADNVEHGVELQKFTPVYEINVKNPNWAEFVEEIQHAYTISLVMSS